MRGSEGRKSPSGIQGQSPDGGLEQWRRQHSKGARSFRGKKILQPGHPDALFFLKKVDDLKTQDANAVLPSK